jgi:hypothetical protein
MFDTRKLGSKLRNIMEAGYKAEYGYRKTLPNLMGYNAGLTRCAVATFALNNGTVEQAYSAELGHDCSQVPQSFRKIFKAMLKAAEH